VILEVIAGGGAAEAGLGADDRITAVDGAVVTDSGFDRSVQSIRGAEGTIVRLTVRKAGVTALTEIPVTRRRIRS
jgi:C-terminal processing protease CtpA/Prc